MQVKRSVPLAQFEPDFVPKNRPPFMCVSMHSFCVGYQCLTLRSQ